MGKVSYSQYTMWSSCPYKWKLMYMEKKRSEYKPNIHMSFGTSMHYVIQMYLTALYSNGAKFANQMDLLKLLREAMAKEYKKERINYERVHLCKIKDDKLRNKKLNEEFEELISKEDMIEFYYDGEKIIKWFLENRRSLFNSVDEELVGIEFPLDVTLDNNMKFVGYIDILIKNKKTGVYRIIDLKVTTKGWGSWKKNDSKTTDQIVLYKKFYSESLNIPLNDIGGEFIILKRKLYEDIPYKQKRILKFIPASGKPTVNKVGVKFDSFLKSCFDDKGNYNKNGEFPKIATENNCRFCDFTDKPEYCNKEN